jgi:UDP-N-acetylglucosamine 1-carboxyvinyltransferase
MAKFIIEGKNSLKGEIIVAGNKNSALPIIAATVLTDEVCILENVPQILDVHTMLKLLEGLGKKIEQEGNHTYQISGSISNSNPKDALTRNLRASILYLSVLLAKLGKVEIVPPGGCVIGRRNVDIHFDVISALGAKMQVDQNKYRARLIKAKPAKIFLTESSVTATENAMLLAAAIQGETILSNAACEPHIADLANVLEKMGVHIQGAGTNQLSVKGVQRFQGFQHRIMPDHIEAGTFAIAAACTQGQLIIHDAHEEHLNMSANFLLKLGVKLKFLDSHTLQIFPSNLVSNSVKIRVGTWPGFPTDLMSPMIVLATQANGVTLCHDWMYESRMFFVDKLIAMGAQITQCDPHRVLVSGPTMLRGQELSSPDIRAGIALMIAALTAKTGRSVIDKAELIDRGYESIDRRLNSLGAHIERID